MVMFKADLSVVRCRQAASQAAREAASAQDSRRRRWCRSAPGGGPRARSRRARARPAPAPHHRAGTHTHALHDARYTLTQPSVLLNNALV